MPLLPGSFLPRVTPAQSIIDLRSEYGAGSLARSLPEPPFTLALSAGVIIPTNCRLDVLGQRGHSIALTILSQRLTFIWRSGVSAKCCAAAPERPNAAGRGCFGDGRRVWGAGTAHGATATGKGHSRGGQLRLSAFLRAESCQGPFETSGHKRGLCFRHASVSRHYLLLIRLKIWWRWYFCLFV